jgi:hypothetical protein
MSIHTNDTLAVNNEHTIICTQLFGVQCLYCCASGECQLCINNFQLYTFSNQIAVLSHPSPEKLLVVCISKKETSYSRNKHQLSINDFWFCILDNPRAVQ